MAGNNKVDFSIINHDHGSGGSLEVLAEFNMKIKENENSKRILLVCLAPRAPEDHPIEYPPDGIPVDTFMTAQEELESEAIENDEMFGMLPKYFIRLIKAKKLETFSGILTAYTIPLSTECNLCSVNLDPPDKVAIRSGDQDEIDAAEALISGEAVCDKCSRFLDDNLDDDDVQSFMMDRIQELGAELKDLKEKADEFNDLDDDAEYI